MKISVAIVEDDNRLRQTLAEVIDDAGDCRCVGQYRTAEDAIVAIPKLKPQIVLMDINLPGMSGVDCVRELAKFNPKPMILMLTVYKDTDSIFRALSAGAVGYLLKPVSPPQLLAAIHDAYTGGAPMTSSIARMIVQSFQQAETATKQAETLTAREREVLEYLAKGYLYKEIGERMCLSYSTVRTHIENIYHKLHVRTRSQAIAQFLEKGRN